MLTAADVAHINAFVLEVLGDIRAELIVAHASEEADAVSQSRHAHSNVGRRAAKVLVEVAALIKRTVVIGWIEILMNCRLLVQFSKNCTKQKRGYVKDRASHPKHPVEGSRQGSLPRK